MTCYASSSSLVVGSKHWTASIWSIVSSVSWTSKISIMWVSYSTVSKAFNRLGHIKFFPLESIKPFTTGPGYPIDGNLWSVRQSINRYQSIKLVNWYRLVLANRWPVDSHTKRSSIGKTSSSQFLNAIKNKYRVARALKFNTTCHGGHTEKVWVARSSTVREQHR